MRDIDRRSFLVTGGLALAWVATGCGKGETPPRGVSLERFVGTLKDRGTEISVVQALSKVLIRPQSRVAFALVDSDNRTRLADGTVNVFWGLDPGAPARGPVRAEYHGEGLGDKGVYVARLDIDRPGNWLVVVSGKPARAAKDVWGGAYYPAVDSVPGPAPGAKAISVATPTVDDHRGVEPYCTRTPPCSMHRLSLDVALANGRPTVFDIGTPKFCTSQVCGPVVDVIDTVAKDLSDRVNFVHAEVYKDDKDAPASTAGFTQTAKAWSLDEEPVTYWIKADGTVTERIVGPTDVREVRTLTQSLLG